MFFLARTTRARKPEDLLPARCMNGTAPPCSQDGKKQNSCRKNVAINTFTT
jgi:hypothetical protein